MPATATAGTLGPSPTKMPASFCEASNSRSANNSRAASKIEDACSSSDANSKEASNSKDFQQQQTLRTTGISVGIRIRMFLGLLDPDPLVRGMDPDPGLARIQILPFSHKGVVIGTAIFTFRVSYKEKYEKNKFFASLKSLKKGVGSRSGSGNQDSYLHQNVTGPQHWQSTI